VFGKQEKGDYMNRRNFLQSSGCSLATVLVAKFGFSKSQAAKVAATDPLAPKKEMILKLLAQMGKTEVEAKSMLAEIEAGLPKAKGKCICKSCPTYSRREKETAFCNALVGQAKNIKDEKGCICGTCPWHQEMKFTYTYYCTRKSELEQLAAEKK
jgi:hypothetical protein